ncbi:MAG TPA: outer membrane lipoprotein-sorting protein [Dongiaceae bacterium]|nr:outer membrane lipoprotein-sorting protein [Dongiaceae bacterium]
MPFLTLSRLHRPRALVSRAMVASILLLTATFSQAEAPLTGKDIIEKAKQNASGFQDTTHKVRMVLVDEKGGKSEREMLLKGLVEKDGTSHSLSIFTAPQREKGIALLTDTKPGEADQQWLYLPSTKRLKRITGANRTSSFRGSEFTFEDLSDQNSSQYRFDLINQEACGSQTCFVIDRFPSTGLETSYSKTRLWIDTEHYRPIKADFYDQSGKLLKTMEAFDYSLFDNKFWKPAKVVMTNKTNGKATEMLSLELKMNTGLQPSEFTELAIRSWR